MTVFMNEEVLRTTAMNLISKGFAVAGVPNEHRAEAVQELRALCTNADVRYVWAGDDMFVDANRWSYLSSVWGQFAAEVNNSTALTPEDRGIHPKT
jgi:hypothetical protein